MLFFRTFATVSPLASHNWGSTLRPLRVWGAGKWEQRLDCFYSWMMSSKKT